MESNTKWNPEKPRKTPKSKNTNVRKWAKKTHDDKYQAWIQNAKYPTPNPRRLHSYNMAMRHNAWTKETRNTHCMSPGDANTARHFLNGDTISAHSHCSEKTNSRNVNTAMYQGGDAIIVRGDLQRRIKQIERADHRIRKSILTNENATAPIAILETYAPHTGYTVDEKTTLQSSAINYITNTYRGNMCLARGCKRASRG